jgi:AcrR family transcriptional regulator
MVNISAGRDPDLAVASGIDLLVRQGYEATSVDELADAAGISRSTFFRRFGSKEDVVFADHDRILAQVSDSLAQTADDPLWAAAEAARTIFDHHVRHRSTSLARHQLLQEVPALRDRELVTSYRYERIFRTYLESTLPEGESPSYGAVAAAAALVAVHNAFLRRWLRDPDTDLRDQLRLELQRWAGIFRPVLYGAAAEERPRGIVVTVFGPEMDRDEILTAVREALP